MEQILETLNEMNDKLDELLKDTNGTQKKTPPAKVQSKRTEAGRKSQASS